MITRACINIVTICAIIAYFLYIISEDFLEIFSYSIFVDLFQFWLTQPLHKQLKTVIYMEFPKRYEK